MYMMKVIIIQCYLLLSLLRSQFSVIYYYHFYGHNGDNILWIVYIAPNSVVTESLFTIVTAFHELVTAVHDGIIPTVTIMTTAVKMMTIDMNATVYFAVIDTESSTGNI